MARKSCPPSGRNGFASPYAAKRAIDRSMLMGGATVQGMQRSTLVWAATANAIAAT